MSHSDDPIYKYQPLFGSWNIEEEIGEGSFGIVYLVSKEELGQKYLSAVKLITIPSKEQFREAKSSLGTDENTLHAYFQDVVENIIKEVNILHSLSGNINILNYHDHSVKERDDKIGWDILIRMEYVTSLPKYLETHTLSREQVIRLGIDICTALELCSKKGIVHRDIKDENIFVNKDEIFKLGDFGIARELSGSGRAASMRGTPLYMAPEVYRGEKYDAAVDIYSLGIVLYKLLNNGRMPFMPPFPDVVKYKDGEQALDRRMSGEALPLPVNAGEDLGRVVLKACAFRSENRYASAEDLKKALEQVRVELSTEGQERIIMPFASSVTQQNSKILEEKPVGTVSKYAGLQDIATGSIDMHEGPQSINQTMSLLSGLGTMSDDQPAKNNHHDSGDKNSIYQENLQNTQQSQNLQKPTNDVSPLIGMKEQPGGESTKERQPGNSASLENEEKSSDSNISSDIQAHLNTQTVQTKSHSRKIWKWVALAGVLALIIGGIVWTNYGRQSDNAQSVITTAATTAATTATTTAATTAATTVANVKVGDIVFFGHYEQDNDTANDKEAIRWRVLSVDGSRALLISVQCLDWQLYDTGFEAVTWETCTLRTWLNSTFLNTAFSKDEQESIILSTIHNPNNQEYATIGGRDTQDKVFLLSIEEAEQYFDDDLSRVTSSTIYAHAHAHSYAYDVTGNCWWWLRSPGISSTYAACVWNDGSVGKNSNSIDSEDYAVRPAMYVDLTSKILTFEST